MNEAPADVPEPSRWHHAHGVVPVEKRRLARRSEALVTSEEEKNKALVRRFWEARIKGDLDATDEMLASHFVNHNRLLPGQESDREDYLRGISAYQAALSERRLSIEDQVAEDDEVVTRFIVHAIHDLGEFLGVAPTGREVSSMAIFIHRISDGKIAEELSLGTVAQTLMEQRLEQERVERERIEQELEVARSIQQASLPEEVPTPEGWQIAPYYQPAREVGGDFYDFLELADGRLGVVVGDATGKVVPAALMMASTRSTLRAVAQACESPGDALRRVNDPLATDIPTNMFVTCFYAILDPHSGRLSYANAGTTCLTCIVTVRPRNSGPEGCLLGLWQG